MAAGCFVGAAVVITACAAGASSSGGTATPQLRVLQLNLCNSGIAHCYTGRSVAEAAAVIRAERPDVVTLDEVCRTDVAVLKRAMSAAEPGGVLVPAFAAALQVRSDESVHCRNGQQYGIGLLARIAPPYRGHTTASGRYSTQDKADTERRVWLCIHAVAHFYACATHLANTDPAVAARQCRYLMHTAIPAMRRTSSDPVVLGADLNLKDGRPPNSRSCLPSGFGRVYDGGTQYVVASAPLTVTGRSISMQGSTDHPALLAELATGRRH